MSTEIESLFNEVRLTFHRIVEVAEELHRDEPVTLGMRGVLEYLLRNGPATVPDIARNRFVTRQHIQKLVNGLLEQELVQLESNPAHQRSSLVNLTRQGERTFLRMRKREDALFDETNFRVAKRDIRAAAETLRTVRDSLPATRRRS
jgi:DNA-binding MarR family transcriptional regulator